MGCEHTDIADFIFYLSSTAGALHVSTPKLYFLNENFQTDIELWTDFRYYSYQSADFSEPHVPLWSLQSIFYSAHSSIPSENTICSCSSPVACSDLCSCTSSTYNSQQPPVCPSCTHRYKPPIICMHQVSTALLQSTLQPIGLHSSLRWNCLHSWESSTRKTLCVCVC